MGDEQNRHKDRVRPRVQSAKQTRPRLRPGEPRYVTKPGIVRLFEARVNPQGRLFLGDVTLAATLYGVERHRNELHMYPARFDLPQVAVCGPPGRRWIWLTHAAGEIAEELRLRSRYRSCAVYVAVRTDGVLVVTARDYYYWPDGDAR
jgi:hypothetical protein